MIIYQALSTYQILECIIHRHKFHPTDECGLLVGDYIKERFSNYSDLDKFFDRVFLFRFGGYHGNTENILDGVRREFESCVGCDLSKIEKYYMAGIHTYLQALMINTGIPFDMFEDGSGNLSRPWILAEIHKQKDIAKYEFMDSFGLYTHTSELIQNKWCDMSNQVDGFYDERAIDFNVLKEFNETPQIFQDDILSFFGVDEKIKLTKSDYLILTQQFSNLGQLTFEDHIKIYSNLLSYYLNGKSVTLKLHPDDIMYYKYLFPNVDILSMRFPSELTPFVFYEKPKFLGTITSTGTNLIHHFFDNTLKFNEEYEKTFKNDSLYYYAGMMVSKLENKKVDLIGFNNVQMNNMLLYAFDISEGELSTGTDSLVIVDDTFIDEESEYNALRSKIEKYKNGQTEGIVFLNSSLRYVWNEIDDTLWDEVSMIVTIKDSDEPDEEKVVYVCTKNKKIKESAMINKVVKFSNTSKSLEISSFEEKMTIKMLEGRLAATERRLLQYIEKEKVLQERINYLESKRL